MAGCWGHRSDSTRSPLIAASQLGFYVNRWPPEDLKASLPFFAYQFSHFHLWHLGLNFYALSHLAATSVLLIGPARFVVAFLAGGYGAANLECFIEQQVNINAGLSTSDQNRREYFSRFRQKTWEHIPWPLKFLEEFREDDWKMDAHRWRALNLGASSSLFCIGEWTCLPRSLWSAIGSHDLRTFDVESLPPEIFSQPQFSH